MSLKLKIGAALAAATLALSMSACAGGSSTNLQALKIGIKFDQPGLGLKEGDKYTGLDVDVATYIAGKLGTTPEKITWIQAPSAQRETLISSGQVDLVVATYSITDARKEKVSFAGPYFIAGQDLLVRADDSSITSVDSLANKKLCSVTGSTSAQKIKDKVPNVNLQEFGTYSECVAALAAGTIDALTTDNTILAGYAAQPAVQGQAEADRPAVQHRELRRRADEGQHRPVQQGHRRDQVADLGRQLAEGGRRQPRPGRLQAGPRQPADSRRLLLTHPIEGAAHPGGTLRPVEGR